MGNDLKDLLWEAAPPLPPPPDGLDRARRRAGVMRRRSTATRLVALPLMAVLLVAAVAAIRDSSRVTVVPAERSEQEPPPEEQGGVEAPATPNGLSASRAPSKSKADTGRSPTSVPAPAQGAPPAPGRVPVGKMTLTSDDGMWTMNLDGTGRRRVTTEKHTTFGWAADGRNLLVVGSTPTDPPRTGVSLLDTTTGRLTSLVDHPGYHVSHAQMSPDGRHIVYAAYEDADFMQGSGSGDVLFIADGDGRNPRQLPYGGRDPSWAPDSRRIAFFCGQRAYEQTGKFLCIINADGTGLRGVGYFTTPVTWSPDGQWLLGRAYEGFAIFRPDGTGERRITARAKVTIPQWTPDSRHIVYVLHVQPKSYGGTVCQHPPCDEPPGVYAVPIDGGDHLRLTTGRNDDNPVVTR